MSPNQAICSDKSIRFPPLAAAQPLTILSWPEALNAKGSGSACRLAISRNACPVLAPQSCCNNAIKCHVSELCWLNHSELVNHTLTHLHRELQNLLEKNRRNFSSGVLWVEKL